MPSLDELENLPTQDQTDQTVGDVVSQEETVPGPSTPTSDDQIAADAAATAEAAGLGTEPSPDAAEVLASTADPAAGTAKRSQTLSESRQAKMDALFKDKKFEIVKEVNLPQGQHFVTPLGNKGRNGFVVKEVGTDNQFAVGATTLKLMAETYGAVTLPEKPSQEAEAAPEEQSEASAETVTAE